MSKSALYSAFATDVDLEKTGIDLQYGVVKRIIDGVEKEVPVLITIARAGGGNTKFERIFEHQTKPYKRMIQLDTLDPKIGKRLMIETFADSVILGWQNVQNAEGEFVDFNRENVIKLMTDLPDLFADIQRQASNATLFRQEVVEADAKN